VAGAERVAIATVDALHAGLIREALDDAGVDYALRLAPPPKLPTLVRREQLVVEVAPAHEAAARERLEALSIDAEQAALDEYARAAPPDEPPRRSLFARLLDALFDRRGRRSPHSPDSPPSPHPEDDHAARP